MKRVYIKDMTRETVQSIMFRREHGEKAKAIAKDIGTSGSTISRVEAGYRAGTLPQLKETSATVAPAVTKQELQAAKSTSAPSPTTRSTIEHVLVDLRATDPEMPTYVSVFLSLPYPVVMDNDLIAKALSQHRSQLGFPKLSLVFPDDLAKWEIAKVSRPRK